MGKKLTITQIKKELVKLQYEELVDIICRLCKSSKEAADQVNLMLGNDDFVDDVLAKAKEKVRGQFFTKRGGYGRLNLAAAKSEIASFKKAYPFPSKIIDLQLYYVECGIEFTNDLGDIDGSFYNSMISMYETVVESILKTGDLRLAKSFAPRLETAVSDVGGIGWGFHEALEEAFFQIEDWIADADLTSP